LWLFAPNEILSEIYSIRIIGEIMQQKNFKTEIKSVTEDGIIEGYASVFNLEDSYSDIIKPGAFSKIDLKNVKLLWQHKPDEPIGLIESLFEDEYGLFIKAKLLLTVQRAKEAYELLKSKAIQGLSIGYRAEKFRHDYKQGVRIIEKIELFEVSLVTFPANKDANIISVKDLSEYQKLSCSLDRAIVSLKDMNLRSK
jgi:uncharacterized protein